MIALLSNYMRAVAEEIPFEVLEENRTYLEDANIEQLQDGLRADGVYLPDYSPVSVWKYGKPEGPIKLFDSGAFYRGIVAVMNPAGVEIEGRDSKTKKLMADYGAEILGVSEENLQWFQEYIFLGQMIIKTEQFLLR